MAEAVGIDLNTCTVADVKHKFRKLAQKYHPDKVKTAETKYCIEARYRQLIVIIDFLIGRCKK
jgi:preprotein translocase subunit Sec63